MGIVFASGDTQAVLEQAVDQACVEAHAVTTISTRWNSLTSL